MEQVQWPLSLVISRKALTKYQLIFRFLFHCKHVNRQLCAAWQVHQVWRHLFHLAWSGGLGSFKFSKLIPFYFLRESVPLTHGVLLSLGHHCSVAACLSILIAFYTIWHLRQALLLSLSVSFQMILSFACCSTCVMHLLGRVLHRF